MFLNISPRKDGRKYLSIVQGYRDSNGKVKKKTVKSIGYLDELQSQFSDPIAHFKDVAIKMTQEKNEEDSSYTFSIQKSELLEKNTDNIKNFGYVCLSHIYHELEIDKFLHNRQRHTSEKYDANTIFKMLVFFRMLMPGSKRFSFDNRNILFEKTNYTLDDVYKCLTFLNKHCENLQTWLNEKVKEKYGRDTNLIYYDVTNYYFEIDQPDDLRKKGVSKEHRPNPIVQMGLFMDNNGLPITYELFPGNQNDSLTYRPNFKRIKENYGFGRVITVADKGMTTGDNIWYTLNTPSKDGYVFSWSVRGADKEMKEWVLDEKGYRESSSGYKRKSRMYPRTIKVTSASGKKMNKIVDEKQVAFYSEKYAERARIQRNLAIEKAKELIKNPTLFNRSTAYGAAKYIEKVEYDKETGKIIEAKSKLLIDQKLIEEEEKYDGYYVILTSEAKKKDDEIIEIYRGLWKIEESFKLTKTELEARPVYVSTESHINAHFLTCFVALLISRILEMKLEHKYSIGKILESLKKSNAMHISENLYLFGYYDDILEDIEKTTGIKFNHKILSLKEIKKYFSESKKQGN